MSSSSPGNPTRIRELSPAKQALLSQRLSGNRGASQASRHIPRREGRDGSKPLSHGQEMLWFIDQYEPASHAYNLPAALRFRGRLNLGALRCALSHVVLRHEALRSRFVAVEGAPALVVDGDISDVPILLVDLSSHTGDPLQAELHSGMVAEVLRPFDLSGESLVRATVFRLKPDEHVLLVCMHHIVSDGWSVGVLFRELAAAYQSVVAGESPSLPPLAIRFSDFAAWQRESLKGKKLSRLLEYWAGKLSGATDQLALPADHSGGAGGETREGGRESLALPKSLAAEIGDLGRQEGATLFATLLAAFKVLLYRYSRQADILVGTPVAGRNHKDTENLIGYFVNTLVLRDDLSGNPTFLELLQRVRETLYDALAHQELPFGRLVEELRPARNPGRTPLVPVMFMLQNESPADFNLEGLQVEPVDAPGGSAKFDLTLCVKETSDQFLAEVEYDRNLFEPSTIRRLLGHFHMLLASIARDASVRVDSLSFLTLPEREQLLDEWNRTETTYPREKSVDQLFEEQVEATPDSIAVTLGKRELSYGELNQRANLLAHRLRAAGVRNGDAVGVCLERSIELIVTLLGILKAGGAYVALDPNYPAERLAFMLGDVAPAALVTQESLVRSLPAHTAEVVVVDAEVFGSFSTANPARGHASGQLAYIAYTSGSTGTPKGVCVPHRGVVRLVRNTNFMDYLSSDVFLQMAPVSFDASTLEIWGPLLNGGRLAICPPGTPSLRELADVIAGSRVSVLWLTSGLFQQLVDECPECLANVRHLLAGGDVLPKPQVARLLELFPACRLTNGYGPTENTTFTCCHAISGGSLNGTSIPIGRPISNTRVYILDPELQPVPIGVAGELFTGGDGLATGYLNRPDLTDEKFVPDPFSTDAGERLYRTGDLARYLNDGTIEFMGRLDNQVKIRGFRVELAEVESHLRQCEGVKECAVIARGDASGSKRMLAYVVPLAGADLRVAALRESLRSRVPDYMVPSVFYLMPELPLSQNGKIDRKSLPTAEVEVAEPNGEAPSGDVETRLARLFEELLEVSAVGTGDSFFDLGGHSLLAVRLVARIEREFGKRLPLSTVFREPTIRQLSPLLGDGSGVPGKASLVVELRSGEERPLFLVHGVGGGMFWGYSNLAQHLGADRSVHAFKSRSLEGREELDSVEAMAAAYIAEMREVQPEGPYQLGGYCFGGNVAYEMACQLQDLGQEVSLLALMDCAPPNSSYMKVGLTPTWVLRFCRNLCKTAIAACHWSSAHRREYLRWRWRSLKAIVRRKLKRNGDDPAGFSMDDAVDFSECPVDQRSLWEAHVRALFRFKPRPYAGRVTLFRSPNHPLLCSFDEKNGWGELAREVEVCVVQGEHESILEEPYVGGLAAALEVRLTNWEPELEGLCAS